jgi:hypothetical protein
MTITENTQTMYDYLDADVLYAEDAPRFLREHDLYVAPSCDTHPDACHLTIEQDSGCACLGWGCAGCATVRCDTHE